jgi:glycosyltransferase involved in cell wall biosynthesis
MQAEMVRLAAQLGLQQRLHFLGLREDMPALYNELDIVVSSSHSEAMPLALMEAMASGLPVVATRVGGVPELVAHGRTGWLGAPGDFSDSAGRCAALLADAALRRAMGERGRRRAVERFDLSRGVASLGQLITQLARPALSAAA